MNKEFVYSHTTPYHAFLAVMKDRVVTNPIYSPELESILGVPGTLIRDFVRQARHEGVAIASGRHGYFTARSIEEYEPSIKDMESRLRSLAETVRCMRQAFAVEEQVELFA
jgi:hypothetical protein